MSRDGNSFFVVVPQPPFHHGMAGRYHDLCAINTWHELCDFGGTVAGIDHAHASEANGFVNVIDVVVCGTAPVSDVRFSMLVDHVPDSQCLDGTVSCSV